MVANYSSSVRVDGAGYVNSENATEKESDSDNWSDDLEGPGFEGPLGLEESAENWKDGDDCKEDDEE
jgi:hypothetical protein